MIAFLGSLFEPQVHNGESSFGCGVITTLGVIALGAVACWAFNHVGITIQ